MRVLKIRLLEGITTWTASKGIAALIMGGGSCFLGLGSVIAIKLAESLSDHRATIQKALFYGSAEAWCWIILDWGCLLVS